jgi:hypothetical protein
MEQTFQDLWNKKRQTRKELFEFVLWTFIETAIGIFRERLVLISPGAIMQTTLKNLGSSVLIQLSSPARWTIVFYKVPHNK